MSIFFYSAGSHGASERDVRESDSFIAGAKSSQATSFTKLLGFVAFDIPVSETFGALLPKGMVAL